MKADIELPRVIRRDALNRPCASDSAKSPSQLRRRQKLGGTISLAAFDVHWKQLERPTQHLHDLDSMDLKQKFENLYASSLSSQHLSRQVSPVTLVTSLHKQ